MKKITLTFFCLLFLGTLGNAKIPVVKEGAPLPSNLFVELAKKINPVVVNISTTTYQKIGNAHNNDPLSLFLKRYYGKIPVKKAQSLGSGFIVSQDGLIITNSHVVDKATEITVKLDGDDSTYKAEIIGKDPRTDIALIKIKSQKPLPVAVLGDSDKALVGEVISAFGNPYGHNNTLTTGVISAINRHVNQLSQLDFIQTDASINPGNSGGPLVNIKGEVIGMNSMVFIGGLSVRAAQGISFAIPSNRIKKIVKSLKEKGYVERGFIGIELTPWNAYLSPQNFGLTKAPWGALVGDVIQGSPAQKAGLKPYDVIIEFNKVPVRGPEELFFLASETIPDQKVKIKIVRKKKTQKLLLTLKVGRLPYSGNEKRNLKQKASLSIKSLDTGFGFKITDYTKKTAQILGVAPIPKPRPLVVSVSDKLDVKLSSGDLILDVNQKPVYKALDVRKALIKGEINFIRILRKGRVFIVTI